MLLTGCGRLWSHHTQTRKHKAEESQEEEAKGHRRKLRRQGDGLALQGPQGQTEGTPGGGALGWYSCIRECEQSPGLGSKHNPRDTADSRAGAREQKFAQTVMLESEKVFQNMRKV